MTRQNLPIPLISSDRTGQPMRRERLQRAALRRSVLRRPVDAADAALIAHWPRLAQRGACGDDVLEAEPGDEAIATSGWFDSTWELSQGLEISEVQPSELPLDSWLQFYLAG